MPTNIFERKIEISDMESVKKPADVISADAPEKPISDHPFSKAERGRSEDLLKQCPLRSSAM